MGNGECSGLSGPARKLRDRDTTITASVAPAMTPCGVVDDGAPEVLSSHPP